jgi:hypothetical protein
MDKTEIYQQLEMTNSHDSAHLFDQALVHPDTLKFVSKGQTLDQTLKRQKMPT